MTVRDSKGRYVKGSSGNPAGRPKVDIKYYAVVQSKVTADDWGEIILKAVEQAKEGNQDARNFLARYLLPSPQQYLDITSDEEAIAIKLIPPTRPIETVASEANVQDE